MVYGYVTFHLSLLVQDLGRKVSLLLEELPSILTQPAVTLMGPGTARGDAAQLFQSYFLSFGSHSNVTFLAGV